MKVYVINLSDAHARREVIAHQMQNVGISYELFEAIRGDAAIRDCIFEGFDETSFMLNTGRHAVLGELGCFASHRELWVRCAELNEPVVVMEDDFNLLPQFSDALVAAAKVIDSVGFIRLQTTLKARRTEVTLVDGFSLSRFTKAPHGSMSYCISPGVARRFLHATRFIDAPVDVFIKKFWEHGQALYALTPFTVVPSVLSVDTTIVGRAKSHKSSAVKRQRFGRKFTWYLKRWVFNWRMAMRGNPLEKQSDHAGDTRLRPTSAR